MTPVTSSKPPGGNGSGQVVTANRRISLKAALRTMTWRGGSEEISRFALVIGAMKAGTSSLYSLLAQHPQVCGSRWKEPEYFSRPGQWARLRKRYPQLWAFDPDRHRCALEASTGYAKFPEATSVDVPDRIEKYAAEHQADIRLIYIMRDPVERADSQIAHQVAMGRADLEDLADEQIRSAISISSYAAQLDRYADFIEQERMLLLNFEDLRSPEATTLLLRQCQHFLGLDEFEHEMERPKNTRASMGAPRSALATSTLESLRERLLPDVLRLRDEFGVDVNRWRNFRDV